MLKELQQKEKEIHMQLQSVREDIRKEEMRLAEQAFGVRVGSIVKDRKGVEYMVTKVKPGFGTPWLEGNPKKKDGTFGIARRNIYSDWVLVIA